MTKKIVDLDSGVITFTFDDGNTVEFDSRKVSAEISRRAMLHGFSQKLGDSYAGAGKDADPLAYAKAAVNDTIAQLYAGDWRAASVGGGGSRVSVFVLALARASGATVEEAGEFADSLDEAQTTAWKAKPAIKALMAAIRAEQAAAKAAKLAADVGNEQVSLA